MSDTKNGGIELLDFDEPDGRITAYAITGKVTTEAVTPLFDRFKTAHEAGRKLRIYAEMERFSGSELGVFAEKAKAMRAILGSIERMVVIGDSRWLSIWVTLFDPVTKPDIKQFGTHDRKKALEWLNED